MGAITIMWKRQLKRFIRAKARIFVSLFQPIMFFVAFGFGFGSIYKAANGGDYMTFLAPGIIAMSVLFISVMNGSETIWDKQFGFLKESLAAPVKRWKIMLGRTLGGATIAVIQGILVLLITMLFGFKPVSFTNLLLAFVVMFMVATFFTALGIAIASRVDDMHAFPMIMNFLVMPIFFLSGALFSLSGLPQFMQKITMFNPLVYGVDALRGLLTGQYSIGLGIDMLVLIPAIIIMIILGSWSFKNIEA